MARFDLSLAALHEYRPNVGEPEDFDVFWTSTLAAARAEGTEGLRMGRPMGQFDAVEVRDVRFSGFDGEDIAAWLLSPRAHVVPRGAVVEYIGYGGGRGHPHQHLEWAAAGYIHLVMDTRGQGSMATHGVTPDAWGTGPAVPGVMTRGIGDPYDYYYRRLFTDAVRAVDAVRATALTDPLEVSVVGGSQGGGIALAVAGLARNLRGVMTDVPFLCHFERAVGLTDVYPYKEIDDYLRIHRESVAQTFRTLSYFDGVNFAKRAHAPALFSVALEDTTCPPSTVFAAKNHYSGAAQIDVYPYNSHEGGGAERWCRHQSWLSPDRSHRGGIAL